MTEIQISPSNRARCKECNSFIKKGIPRVLFRLGYFCHRCAELKLKEEIDSLKKIRKDFKDIKKRYTKEIILSEL